MSRRDQSITFLNRFGYNVFRVPRMSAQPLEVLSRSGKDLSHLGGITDLITGGAQPPPPVHRDDLPRVEIEGTQSSKVKTSIGINILGSFISAFGGSSLGLQMGFTRARSITFKYTGVKEDSIDVLLLQQFINAAEISRNIPPGTLAKLIDDEFFVITSILKTNKVIVAAQGEAGTAVQVDVPVIQQAIGGNVKVGTDGALTSKVVFEGSIAIPFAFQAMQLQFDESGEFLTTRLLPAGDAAARERRNTY